MILPPNTEGSMKDSTLAQKALERANRLRLNIRDMTEAMNISHYYLHGVAAQKFGMSNAKRELVKRVNSLSDSELRDYSETGVWPDGKEAPPETSAKLNGGPWKAAVIKAMYDLDDGELVDIWNNLTHELRSRGVEFMFQAKRMS